MTGPSPAQVRRLAFVRYLHGLAESQRQQPDLLAASAVLTFHDAVELFLVLAGQHVGAKIKQNTNFLEYWDLINDALQKLSTPTALSNRGELHRLNDIRVALKHKDILPHRREINEAGSAATAFLVSASQTVFNVHFHQISLLDFIEYEPARVLMKAAQRDLDGGDFQGVSEKCALAMYALLHDYQFRSADDHWDSPFDFGTNDLRVPTASLTRVRIRDRKLLRPDSPYGDLPDDVFTFFEKVGQSLDSLSEAVRLLAFGIDYRRYIRFQMLSGLVSENFNGDRSVHGAVAFRNVRDDAQFCFDFIVESALKLQDFDYRVPVEPKEVEP